MHATQGALESLNRQVTLFHFVGFLLWSLGVNGFLLYVTSYFYPMMGYLLLAAWLAMLLQGSLSFLVLTTSLRFLTHLSSGAGNLLEVLYPGHFISFTTKPHRFLWSGVCCLLKNVLIASCYACSESQSVRLSLYFALLHSLVMATWFEFSGAFCLCFSRIQPAKRWVRVKQHLRLAMPSLNNFCLCSAYLLTFFLIGVETYEYIFLVLNSQSVRVLFYSQGFVCGLLLHLHQSIFNAHLRSRPHGENRFSTRSHQR